MGKKQATLQHFVAYCELSIGTFLHKNICVMSDTRDHTTITVMYFYKLLIPFLRLNFLSRKNSILYRWLRKTV